MSSCFLRPKIITTKKVVRKFGFIPIFTHDWPKNHGLNHLLMEDVLSLKLWPMNARIRMTYHWIWMAAPKSAEEPQKGCSGLNIAAGKVVTIKIFNMEPKPDENNVFKTGNKQHVLKKILSDKENKKSNFSSSSSSKKSEESKKTSPNSEKSEEDVERPASPSSPEPNCAICLEPLQNKSFTDSCFHTFCFTCLLEWSKVKAECPLCKQQFKSIVHNVKKDLTFDEYVIGSKTGKFMALVRTDQARFRYPTTMTASRILERNRATYQESYQSQIASHRMRFAPHSVNLYSSAQIMSRLPCPFRRRVYEQNFWVKTPLGSRTRLATPEFYKRNPGCTHRLVPWLNRELVSLWQDNEAHVSFVLELIMSLVQRYHINSQEFLIHIEPYMGRNTHHFIHEFHAFAISPYDMENYDAHADYGLVPHSTDDAERSSPDSDVIAIFTGENSSLPRQNRERKQNMRQQALKHLKMILKKSGGNSWESYLSPASSSYMSSSWSNPGPSTSGFRASSFLSVDANTSNFASISDVDQTDDDEIQVLDIVKPQAERTPEIVDLSSDEEIPVTVIDVSSDEGNFSLVCSPSRMTPPLAAISVNDASSDIECVLEYQPSTSRDIPTTSEISAEKDTKVEAKQEQKELHHDSSDTELEIDVPMDEDAENEVKKGPKLASAIVRPWMTESESSRKAFVPHIKRCFSTSYLDGSLSESSDSERKRSTKKLKLQSVVACFSIDRSGSKRDSSHRSSHKKRKEKKKKKKHKHIRQHKHNRIYSDSESG
ncbi:E3 ubiquitin-protein ligase Topors [Araneus ventricosus]|uniref:E3 ubiquitin-protein ligase Topors n=1 Tax=Araneus ventricosus TaxID=182803 RepID=A0A4Y2E411_ARAVE|nr:E3 ubiquitin-protein ligase Topors [Araneus ventricosus]